jgi:hypothetical protein
MGFPLDTLSRLAVLKSREVGKTTTRLALVAYSELVCSPTDILAWILKTLPGQKFYLEN